jgi:hypothetical protein
VLVQCFRRDIGAIRPSNRATLNEESSEVRRIIKGNKNRTGEPLLKIDRTVNSVVEDQSDLELAAILGTDDCRQHAHSVALLSPMVRFSQGTARFAI